MVIDYKKFPKAQIFATHGVEFVGQRGDQFYGTCPFTGKEEKFYVNNKTWLWDSKVTGQSGNIAQFLKAIYESYLENYTDTQLIEELANHRSLPAVAFRPWYIAHSSEYYVLPVKDLNGTFVDLRRYWLKSKDMRSTAGCHVGLFGAHNLADAPGEPIYLCEGEWDTIAMQYLLKILKQPGVALGSPGAGIFKQDWAAWFAGRKVHVIYDHDEPGMRGEVMIKKRLTGTVRSISYTHWPDELPEGFDLRDWIVYGLEKNTPGKCLARLSKLFSRVTREEAIADREALHQADPEEARPDGAVIRIRRPRARKPSLADVHNIFRTWMHLDSTDVIDMLLAVVFSQRIKGDPVWLFLVGPSGGGKTLNVTSLNEYDGVYPTSSLTPHALISGANWQGGQDPSLIPRLNGKVLVVKDFTSILGLRENDQDEIFSILRDAFDGHCSKVFGNGVERAYDSRFTVIAATTPRIYDVAERHASLGERFLKFCTGDNLNHTSEREIIARAIENVDSDTEMRSALQRVVSDFLTYTYAHIDPEKIKFDNVMQRKIILLSEFGARIRGSVVRDRFRADMMMGKPFSEIGSRFGVQLAKLARALAIVRGRTEVDDTDYRLIKKIVLDTVSQRNEDVVRCLHQHSPTGVEWMSTTDLAVATRYPQTTVRRILEDMYLLRVVGRRGEDYRQFWRLDNYVRVRIAGAELYTTPEELIRSTGARLVLRRPRAESAPASA